MEQTWRKLKEECRDERSPKRFQGREKLAKKGGRNTGTPELREASSKRGQKIKTLPADTPNYRTRLK